jgi:hypothetical protein
LEGVDKRIAMHITDKKIINPQFKNEELIKRINKYGL